MKTSYLLSFVILICSFFPTRSAIADAGPFRFEMTLEFGNPLSVSGDPTCVATFHALIKALETSSAEKASCLSYNEVDCDFSGGMAPDQERGTFDSMGGPFEVGLYGQTYQEYKFDRIFSGVLFDSSGKADITATTQSGEGGCRLNYQALFSFSRD